MALQVGSLADDIFAATYRPEKRFDNPWGQGSRNWQIAREVQAYLRSAQKYTLTDDVILSAIDLGVLHPDILLAMLKRARLPFPKMWIEWNHTLMLSEQGIDVAPDASTVVGCCIEQISAPGEYPVFRISEMGFETDPGVTTPRVVVHPVSIVYSVDQPILERMPSLFQERSSLARLTQLPKDTIDQCLLGTPWHRAWDSEDTAEREHLLNICRNLASYSCYTLSPQFPSYEHIYSSDHRRFGIYESLVQRSILETSGTWRFLVSVIALLQTREFTQCDARPMTARRRFVSGKSIPYLQHVTVSVKVPRQVVIRRMIESVRESLPQPRRTVEGYWRSRHGNDATCEHVDVAETPNRYRCALCKRPLFFTPAHERGDATVGYVTKDRVVEPRN